MASFSDVSRSSRACCHSSVDTILGLSIAQILVSWPSRGMPHPDLSISDQPLTITTFPVASPPSSRSNARLASARG